MQYCELDPGKLELIQQPQPETIITSVRFNPGGTSDYVCVPGVAHALKAQGTYLPP